MTKRDALGASVDDALKHVEGMGALVSTLDGLKKGLEELGWGEATAERAAIMAFDNVMKTNIAEINARSREGE